MLALLFTHLFFFEYRMGPKQVHVPYDMDGYHYPLADYAFQSLKHGRFPEWDPTMYSGLPFAANVQAALFYPPQWLAFAFDWGRERLSYRTFQDLLFLHVWAGFVLCWLWFRWRQMHWLAATLGAGVFAYSGYLMHQLQHFGLVAGYAWFPLGCWGVDRIHASRSVRPAWMVVLASALCFLAGYTPFWVVLCAVVLAYAVARRQQRFVLQTSLVALAVSLGISAIQLLPAMEASNLMVRDFRYGPVDTPWFHLSWVVPNYFNYALGVPVDLNNGLDLLYVGAVGLAGSGLAVFRRNTWPSLGPALAILGACAVPLLDPFGSLTALLQHWALGGQLVRGYYFLAGVTTAVALATAVGIHGFVVSGVGEKRRRPAGVAAAAFAIAWSMHLLIQWRSGTLASGWWSAADASVGAALVLLCLWLFRQSATALRAVLAAALLLLAAAEYKAFGTSKRVNTAPEAAATVSDVFSGLDLELYRQMRAQPEYRSAISAGGLYPTKLRHMSLTTPQGFDPLLPTAYRHLVESVAKWHSDREFEFDLARPEVLRLFGVRFVITSEYSPRWAALKADANYRMLEPRTSYFKVFELQGAVPPYGWEAGMGEARATRWEAELREFDVRTEHGGVFRLSEQHFPGWWARLDGTKIPVQRCREALQCVSVPVGEHRLEFEFASQSVQTGMWLSLITIAGCLVWLIRGSRQRQG